MNSINVVLTVIMFALFAVAGLLVKFPDKGDDLMVQLAKGQLFSEEGVYAGNVEFIEGTLEQRIPDGGGWKNVATGERIISGMELRTLADSRAIIKFDDGSELRMSEVSQIVFNNKLYQINIEMINGFVYHKVDFVASRKYNVNIGPYRVEAGDSNFAINKDFQKDPELFVFEDQVILFLGDERKNEFVKNRKVYLRDESVEETSISQEEMEGGEVIWNFKLDEKE